jgi:hypothetical protein
MPMMSDTAIALARIGCNVSIDGSAYMSDTIESIARIVTGNKRQLTVRNADKMMSTSIEKIVRIGSQYITIEI